MCGSPAQSGAPAQRGVARQRVGRPPNVVLILADDLGYGDIGVFGATRIATPNIDRLAHEGVRLTSYYAPANVCTPSRAGLLTGRYPIRTGLGRGVILPNDTGGLPPGEITIPELLRPLGYATGMVGKWHLGHVGRHWPPTRHGFDEFYGVPYSNDLKPLAVYRAENKDAATTADVARESDGPMAALGAIFRSATEAKPTAEAEDMIVDARDQETLTQRFTDAAVRFIDRHHDGPFFLYVAYTAPHLPLHPAPKFQGRSQAYAYGDVVQEIDHSVGRMLAALERHGVGRRTLVIFTSDNGPWFEGSTGGFHGAKGNGGWEGGFRVPFVARYPGVIPPGLSSGGIAMGIDLLPTIAALAGAWLPADRPIDGRDIRALLEGSERSPHDVLLLFNRKKIAGVRTPRWKLVTRPHYRTREADRTSSNYALLFDMLTDPEERYSAAATYPDTLATMRRRLNDARAEFAPLLRH